MPQTQSQLPPGFEEISITPSFLDEEAKKFGLSKSSGYRSPSHNKAVGGVPSSYHLKGEAGDYVGTPEQKRKFYDYLKSNYKYELKELLNEGSHIHAAATGIPEGFEEVGAEAPVKSKRKSQEGNLVRARKSLGLKAQTEAPKGEFDFSKLRPTKEIYPEAIKGEQAKKKRLIKPKSPYAVAPEEYPTVRTKELIPEKVSGGMGDFASGIAERLGIPTSSEALKGLVTSAKKTLEYFFPSVVQSKEEYLAGTHVPLGETIPGQMLEFQLSPLQKAEQLRKEKGLGVIESWFDPEVTAQSGLSLIPFYGPMASRMQEELNKGDYKGATQTAVAMVIPFIHGKFKAAKDQGLVKGIEIEPHPSNPITSFDDTTKNVIINPTKIEEVIKEGRNPVAAVEEGLQHELGHALVDESSKIKVGDRVTVKNIKGTFEVVDASDPSALKLRTARGGIFSTGRKTVEKASKTLLKDTADKVLPKKKAKTLKKAIDKGTSKDYESEEKVVEEVTKTGDALKKETIPEGFEEALDDLINRPGARPTEEQQRLLGVEPKEVAPDVAEATKVAPEKGEVLPRIEKSPVTPGRWRVRDKDGNISINFKTIGEAEARLKEEQTKAATKEAPKLSESQKMKQAALALSRAEFDALDPSVKGAIGQAFGVGGKVYTKADINNIWNAIQKAKVGEKVETYKDVVDNKVVTRNLATGEVIPEPLSSEGGEGVGAMKAGALATSTPEIEQLRQTIESKATNIPKEDYSLKSKAERSILETKDNVKNTLGNLKTLASDAWNSYKNLPPVTDFTRAVDRWQGRIQEGLLYSKKFIRDAKKLLPSRLRREAITRYIDAGGDIHILQQGSALSPDKFSRLAYEAALKLTPEEIDIANNIQSYYDAMMQKGFDEGILWTQVQSYINRMYKSKDAKLINAKIQSDMQLGKLPTKFTHARQRFYEYLLDAEIKGMKTKTTDVAELIATYNSEFNNTLSAREFVKNAQSAKAADGRPIVTVSGGGGPTGENILIRPSARVRPRLKGGPPGAKVDISDYRRYDHPAFRKWKYATSTEEGVPILLEGEALIHPDYVKEFRNRFDTSIFDQYKLLKGAKWLKAQIKAPKMAFSAFHQAHVDQHALTHRVFNPYKGALEPLDPSSPAVQKAIYSGVKLVDSRGMSAFAEGVSGGEWIFKVPLAGPKLRAYTEWLFEDHIPKLKVMYNEQALGRNLKAYSKEIAAGKVTREQVERLTAGEANASFGELNLEQLGRAKTTQDIMSFILLAPDFTEARFKYVGQALKPYGREQRIALMGGAVAMYVTTKLLNGLFNNGDMNLDDPKHAFEVKVGDKWVGIRSVQEDIIRIMSAPGQSLINRLNPVLTAGGMAATGRDRFGNKIHPATTLGVAKKVVGEAVQPMAIDPDLERTALQVLGFSVTKFTDPGLQEYFDTLDSEAERISDETGLSFTYVRNRLRSQH